MSGSQSPEDPTAGLSNTSPSDSNAKQSAPNTAQPEPGESDPQATVSAAEAQPTQRLESSGQPTQMLHADYPTELLGAQQPPGTLPPPVLAPPNPSTRTGAYPAARWFHGATALVAWAAVILQLLVVIEKEGLDADLPSSILNYFGSFVIWANVVVAIVASVLATNPIRQSSSFAPNRLNSVVLISMSTLIYLVVVEPTFDPEGWQLLADIAVYYLVPLLALVGYGMFGPRPRFGFRDILPALPILAIWAVYTLFHGALSGWYPYSFVNAETLGYGRVAVNLVWMLVVFLMLAVAFILLDKRLPWAPRR
jgi:hypothetical protein